VIVDDGSTDRTKEILDHYAAKDKRFRVYYPEHLGRIPVLNKAVELARGVYLAINDADDVNVPERLELEGKFLDEHPDHALVGSFATKIDTKSEEIGSVITAPTRDTSLRKVMVRYNPFVHSSMLYRREIVEKSGLYSDRFLPGFEWEMYVKLMQYGKAANLPLYLVKYRTHEKSLTWSRKKMKRLMNVTRARFFVWRALRRPLRELPFIFMGVFDLFSRSG